MNQKIPEIPNSSPAPTPSGDQPSLIDSEITLTDFILILWPKRYLIVLFAVLSTLAGYFHAKSLPDKYTSETLILVVGNLDKSLGHAGGGLPFAGGVFTTESPRDKLELILKSRTITERLIEKCDLLKVIYPDKWDPALNKWRNGPPSMPKAARRFQKNMARFDKARETPDLRIFITMEDPELASRTANSYTTLLGEFLESYALNINANFQVIDKAIVPNDPSGPDREVLTGIAGIGGFMTAIFLCLAWSALRSFAGIVAIAGRKKN